jgi:hypothetical protein
MRTATIVVLALLLVLVGVVVAGVGTLQILDPVGTKHADDNDPFGAPAPR